MDWTHESDLLPLPPEEEEGGGEVGQVLRPRVVNDGSVARPSVRRVIVAKSARVRRRGGDVGRRKRGVETASRPLLHTDESKSKVHPGGWEYDLLVRGGGSGGKGSEVSSTVAGLVSTGMTDTLSPVASNWNPDIPSPPPASVPVWSPSPKPSLIETPKRHKGSGRRLHFSPSPPGTAQRVEEEMSAFLDAFLESEGGELGPRRIAVQWERKEGRRVVGKEGEVGRVEEKRKKGGVGRVEVKKSVLKRMEVGRGGGGGRVALGGVVGKAKRLRETGHSLRETVGRLLWSGGQLLDGYGRAIVARCASFEQQRRRVVAREEEWRRKVELLEERVRQLEAGEMALKERVKESEAMAEKEHAEAKRWQDALQRIRGGVRVVVRVRPVLGSGGGSGGGGEGVGGSGESGKGVVVGGVVGGGGGDSSSIPVGRRRICVERGRLVRVEGGAKEGLYDVLLSERRGVKLGAGEGGGGVEAAVERRGVFEVDRALGPEANQASVFAEVKPLIEGAWQRKQPACVFAFGASGSGKTHSLFGTRAQPGILPRVTSLLFSTLFRHTTPPPLPHGLLPSHPHPDTPLSPWCFLLAAEIYNGSLRDLLRCDDCVHSFTLPRSPELGSIELAGITCCLVSSASDAHTLLSTVARRRSTASTALNASSSRSHALVRLLLPSARKFITVDVVDLAGAEAVVVGGRTVTQTHASKSRAKEAAHVHSDLAAMAAVVEALAARKSHVPFRAAKLTAILQPSLQRAAQALALVTVAEDQHSATGVRALRFACKLAKAK